MELQGKEKISDKSKENSTLKSPNVKSEKEETKLYNIKNMKKNFRTSAKAYKLNNKGELMYIRTFKEKDKITKTIKQKKN